MLDSWHTSQMALVFLIALMPFGEVCLKWFHPDLCLSESSLTTQALQDSTHKFFIKVYALMSHDVWPTGALVQVSVISLD